MLNTMTDIDDEKQRLLDTVQAYAELAREKGFVAAAREYMAEDAVMIAENLAPIKGRETICAHLATNADLTITWAPFYVDMAASCDMAYTLGSWQIHAINDDGQPNIHPGPPPA
jgi:ketosteroid isomerase-like protein